MKREHRKFPWGTVLLVLLGLIAVGVAIVVLLITRYHFHVIHTWPYLAR
jgi:hypothetical protein